MFNSRFKKINLTHFSWSHLTDKISSGFNRGLLIGIILIYLQKAFDTKEHCVLLRELLSLGFLNDKIAWFRPYLVSRKLHVTVYHKFSATTK